ncbi:MAG TPA: type I-E CRISPR-associated endoribonuclease Cas2e [Methanomassiliicoccales archaeon]
MLIMILEKTPSSLRGELSRWMIEPKVGVFLGKVSAEVRERLWVKCMSSIKEGGIIQAWSTNNEQGFAIRTYGDTSKCLVDFDGLTLVREYKL